MKNINFNIELTQQEKNLIIEHFRRKIADIENSLVKKVKELGYEKYEVKHEINIRKINTSVIEFDYRYLDSKILFDKDLELNTHLYSASDINLVSNTFTMERNKIGYEIMEVRKKIQEKIDREKELEEAEKVAKIELEEAETKNWIDENGSEYLKNLHELYLDYKDELFKEYVEKANIPNFYKIGGIDSYTERPPCEVVTVGKKLKDLGFEIIGFSTNSVEIRYTVFGIEKYILCRP